MSQPPALHSELTLAELPGGVGWARRHVVDVLQRWAVSDELVEAARLIVSELATNAVSHAERLTTETTGYEAGSGSLRTFTVSLTLTGRSLEIQVGDQDPTPPTLRRVGTDAVSGRGIFIVAALSSSWGYYPATNGAGKVVWANLLLK